jgi:transposase
MAAPRKYPGGLRERTVRLAVDTRKDPATRQGALARIGGQLGINPETLRNWVTQTEVDAGSRPGTTTTDADRLTELEPAVKELRRANAMADSTGERTSPVDYRVSRLPPGKLARLPGSAVRADAGS